MKGTTDDHAGVALHPTTTFADCSAELDVLFVPVAEELAVKGWAAPPDPPP